MTFSNIYPLEFIVKERLKDIEKEIELNRVQAAIKERKKEQKKRSLFRK